MMPPIKNKPVFVVFEGMDGTGKSTCASLTAEKLGARLLSTPSPRLRAYREEIISSYAGSQEAAHLFYLSTVVAASEEIARHLADGESVVLDRYFLSTEVYAAFRGSSLVLGSSIEKMLQPADLTVFLDTPLPIRRERLRLRGSKSVEDEETLTADADMRLRQQYAIRKGSPVAGQWLEVDSSALSIEEISMAICLHVNRIRHSAALVSGLIEGERSWC